MPECPNRASSALSFFGFVGVGLDLIDLAHFDTHYGEGDADLLARCFTANEIIEAGTGCERLARLAARFAVKEAVFKSLGGGAGIALTDIEYFHGDDGEPRVRLMGAAQSLAQERGATDFRISVSHSASTAAAVVIALSSALS